MISAVDSSVILDVLADNPRFAEASLDVLRMGAQQGKLIVSECVIAEIFPALSDPSKLKGMLSDWELEFVPSTFESAAVAGQMFAAYLKRSSEKRKVIADFLIGAHAQVRGYTMLTLDTDDFAAAFPNLPILSA